MIVMLNYNEKKVLKSLTYLTVGCFYLAVKIIRLSKL